MEKRVKKSISLFQLFLRQMIWLAFDVILELVIAVIIITIALECSVVFPANYAQNYVTMHEKQIAQSSDVSKEIPYMCSYGIYDQNKVYQAGNFTKAMKKDTNEILMNPNGNNSYYSVIKRADGYCVIYYDLTVHFKSQKLDQIFPQIELFFYVLLLVIFLLLIVWNAYSFGKKLKKQFKPLLHLIEQIKERELEFEEETSQIKEINDISHALYDMKVALSDSLKKEWDLKQQKRNNMRALAHDIKTPLTIIKGNAQLILEEEQLESIYESANSMNQSVDQMEEYIKLLMDEMRSDEITNKKEEIHFSDFIAQLKMQMEQLCSTNEVNCEVETSQISGILEKDELLLLCAQRVYRAIINIVGNAMEYCTEDMRKSKIIVSLYQIESYFCIEVLDDGKGFSKEALLHGKEQFFTSHKERQHGHYGMGLYFANEVAIEHGGYLQIGNQINGGGDVIFAVKRTFHA